jgi:hypothetical protein
MRYIIPLNFEDDIIQMTPFLEISFDLGSLRLSCLETCYRTAFCLVAQNTGPCHA